MTNRKIKSKEGKMIKPPASLTFDFDETMCLYEHYDLLDRYRGTKHQYIRRDLIQKILDHVGVITYEPHQVILELVDKIEQSEQ